MTDRENAGERTQLDHIEDKLDVLAVQQASLAASLSVRCPFEAGRIDDLASTVWGNGTPGLRARVENLERIHHIVWVIICVATGLAGIMIGSYADSFFARGGP
ncbi:MAG TPA: hypothetical protein PK867_06205 [Pirellulales bacterium]|nr:hypothetical protein [Pirellulales bacterium]